MSTSSKSSNIPWTISAIRSASRVACSKANEGESSSLRSRYFGLNGSFSGGGGVTRRVTSFAKGTERGRKIEASPRLKNVWALAIWRGRLAAVPAIHDSKGERKG